MPTSEETLAAVRDALDEDPALDAARITVIAEGDEVVLRGSVPTHGTAEVAMSVADAHAAEPVRSTLDIDRGLREDAAAGDAASAPAGGSAEHVRPARRSTAGTRLSSQVSEFRPVPVEDDLATDADTALAENLAWDPPEAAHSAPTGFEQRGVPSRETDSGEPTEEDPAPEDEDPSLPGLSAAELAQDARRRHAGEEDER